MVLKRRAAALVGLGALAVLVWAGASLGAPSDTFRSGVESVISEAGKTPERARLHALCKLNCDYILHEFPEFATEVGAAGLNARWTDMSAAAIARRKADLELPVKALATIDRTKLAPEDALNYDLFRRQVDAQLEGRRFPWELMPVTQLYGPQHSVPQILSEQTPSRTVADYEAIVSRLRGTPALVEQTIASMKEGLRRGVTPPKITLRDLVAQADAILVDDPTKSPLLGPFQRMPDTMPIDRREALKGEAARLLREQVVPAFRRLRDFLASEDVPNCRESAAMSALPDGPAWYAYQVSQSTSTRLTPRQIHEIGLEEVRQIRAEMERLMRATGFAGDLPAFFEFLRTDSRFFYSRPEDLLAGYREIAKRADPEVIRLFGRMPRLPYGVVPMPAHNAASRSAGAYDPGSLAAGRPGSFSANLSAVDTRPKWEMEALVLHEAVPGHHLQIALAQEQPDLPNFRKYGGYEAYGEGRAPPRTSAAALRLDSEELRRRPAEHRHALVVAETGRAEDVVDRRPRPRERVIGAHDDLVRTGLGHQVAQRLGREDERVEVELLEIFRRLLPERFGAPVRKGHADRVGACRVGRQIAAAVRRADLQPGEPVERAFEDQVRERDRRLERIADGVLEPAAAPEPRLEIGRGAVGLRVDEHQHAQLLGLGPERVEPRVGQILAGDAAAHAGAEQAVLPAAFLELLRGEVRVLQRHRRERDEAIGIRRAGLGKLIVPNPDELAGDVPIGLVPVGG